MRTVVELTWNGRTMYYRADLELYYATYIDARLDINGVYFRHAV